MRRSPVTAVTNRRRRFCKAEIKRICSALMRTALMVLALLAAPAFASQSVWKWVDEKGVTHYADRPVPGAQRVEISVGSRSDSVTPNTTPSTQPEPPPAVTGYRDFEIWKPGNQDTLVNTGGLVEVRLRLDPSLQPTHALYLYLDGKLVEGFPQNALEYTLREIPRGTHTLVAVINDRNGKRVQDTPVVSFTVRQESIAQPPVGPALRQTPPKPRGQTANKLPTEQPSYATLNGQRVQIDPRTNAPVQTKKK